MCCCWIYTTFWLVVSVPKLSGWFRASSVSVLNWWFLSLLILVNYFFLNRQELFIILRDFSGMTQVVIPQKEVSHISAAAFLPVNVFMLLMFWNVCVYPVCLAFEINTVWPYSRVCHQGHRNCQMSTSRTGEQGLVFVVRTFNIVKSHC